MGNSFPSFSTANLHKIIFLLINKSVVQLQQLHYKSVFSHMYKTISTYPLVTGKIKKTENVFNFAVLIN